MRIRVKDSGTMFDGKEYEVEKDLGEDYMANGMIIPKTKAMVLPDEDRMTGKKYDKGKTPWFLFPFQAAEEIVKVMAFGAYTKGYGEFNWREVKEPYKRYYSACLRHLAACQDDIEAKDPESGFLHLAHAGCCIIFMLGHIVQKKALSGQKKEAL